MLSFLELSSLLTIQSRAYFSIITVLYFNAPIHGTWQNGNAVSNIVICHAAKVGLHCCVIALSFYRILCAGAIYALSNF